MEEKRERISGLTAGGLIYAAVLVDCFKLMLAALGLVPVVGILGPILSIFVGIISALMFLLFFQYLDVDLMERIFAKGLGYLLASFIPFGGTTFATALTIYFVRRDDRAYNEERGL